MTPAVTRSSTRKARIARTPAPEPVPTGSCRLQEAAEDIPLPEGHKTSEDPERSSPTTDSVSRPGNRRASFQLEPHVLPSEEPAPRVAPQIEPSAELTNRSDESASRISARVETPVSDEMSTRQDDPEPVVEQNQTPERPDAEEGTAPLRRKTPLVVETAKLLQNAEYLAQQQQRDEFLRTKILASGSVKRRLHSR